jgi:hypothetical protein
MARDQVRKEPLHGYLPEFVGLFLPRIAEQIDFSRLQFLEKEVFTDLRPTEAQEAKLERLIRETGAEEVAKMVNVYEEKGMERGLLQAIELGLELRFGSAALSQMDAIRTVSSVDVLERGKDALKVVQSPEELRSYYTE